MPSGRRFETKSAADCLYDYSVLIGLWRQILDSCCKEGFGYCTFEESSSFYLEASKEHFYDVVVIISCEFSRLLVAGREKHRDFVKRQPHKFDGASAKSLER